MTLRETQYSLRVSPRLKSTIGKVVVDGGNILQNIDKIFTLHSEFAPDVLIVSDDGAFVVNDEGWETSFVRCQDFFPISGIGRYKLSECYGEIELEPVGNVLDEGFNPSEGFYTLNTNWRLTADSEKLREKIIDSFPSLNRREVQYQSEPIFCAVKQKGGYCDILGVYLLADFGNWEDSRDYEAIREGVFLLTGLLHETARCESKFNVSVHSSIIDQLANEDPSIPTGYLDKEAGILEHPMSVTFSKKVSNDLRIPEGIEWCIFRDDDYLFVTAMKSRRIPIMCRLKFSDLGGRINKKRISIAIKKSLALRNDRGGISWSALQTIQDKLVDTNEEPLYSRLGVFLKYHMMDLRPVEPHSDHAGIEGDRSTLVSTNGNSEIFDRIIPVLIHLLFARLDPNLKGEIKVKQDRKTKHKRRHNRNKKRIRYLVWGNDSVRYIVPDQGSSVSRHWCNAHIREFKLKNDETIKMYQNKGFVVVPKKGEIIGYGPVRGHWRGSGEEIDWDGSYSFGKRPSYYSQKAIRWIKWMEKKDGVIIQHAEKGGEQRFGLNEGHIQVDGWCKETNTVYEFHGDVYHGNPEKFDREEQCHPFEKGLEGTAGYLHDKTIQRENAIRSIGLNLVSIWESEWDEIENIFTQDR